MNSRVWFYQVIRRKNDSNGNPYRLVMVYCPRVREDTTQYYYVESCYETRSSQVSNLENDLQKECIYSIEELFLAPKEYKALCTKYKAILSYEN
jgi:hypothetical protein